MNKLFLRIILGLVAVVFALGLFSMLVINLTNTVREEHYWHDFLEPYFSDLTSLVSVSDFAEQASGMRVVEYDDALVSDRIDKRLVSGQLVVDYQENAIIARYLQHKKTETNISGESAVDQLSTKLVTLESEQSGDQFYEFAARYIQQKLTRIYAEEQFNAENYQNLLSQLEADFGLQLSLVTSENPINSSFLLEQLAQFGYVKVEVNNLVSVYLNLPTGEIYHLILPEPYSALSVPVLFFLMVCAIVSIALLAFSFVQSFDRRIRSIETAASRISRGELDARVTSASDEDAISRLGMSFNSMADHIQRLMYVQKEMIHAVSHELRTPVARIRFGVQMIEDCQTPESVQKQVKGIDGDIQELDELIDEILTYARLEQGGPILAFQQADVAAIVSQVVAEQSSDKPEISISAQFKEGSDIWKESEIETRYIHRSIQNLVGNAKRYADSKVRVICSFDAETCRIDVEDDGPGIPEDQWESVFTPFARLDDSRTRSSGGYGLGLSIVRRILYWHGGQAFLGRSSMGGAKFSLVWPRKQNV